MSVIISGPRGTRTLDLLNAIEARSQLRHGPSSIIISYLAPMIKNCDFPSQVDLEGFEPSTSSVRLKRAPKLRYRPNACR